MIVYESKKSNNEELKYSIHERELLAIIHALQVWRHYLLGSGFEIEDHHRSLRYLTNHTTLNQRHDH